MVVRSRIAWLTGPPHGRASLRVGSRAFTALPLAMSSAEPTAETTTPGELLAAAHGGALAAILARMLEDADAPARELVVETVYELVGDWYEVGRIEFRVFARVGGGAQPPLEKLAHAALDRCTQSLGLGREGAAVTATLQ
jgi:organic hydroperoxide reductase OsmC/OhrA